MTMPIRLSTESFQHSLVPLTTLLIDRLGRDYWRRIRYKVFLGCELGTAVQSLLWSCGNASQTTRRLVSLPCI